MNADGSGQRRLIAGHSVNTDPRWSPDGRSIAFTHGTPCSDNGCKLNIWLIRPDGTGARPLTRDGGSAEPSWSPDGKKIAFDRYNAAKGRSDLYVMNADGTGSHPLTSFTSKLDVSRPAWSPDGRTIAFIANAGTLSGGALGFIGADGKHPKPINSGYALDAPAWSPDGNWIVFEVASGGAQGELWAVKNASLSPSRPVCFDANGEGRCAGTPVDLPDTSFNPDWQPLP
jgi:Tol biopolymer transport system component